MDALEEFIKLIWTHLEKLPVPPTVTLSVISVVIFSLLIVCICYTCRRCGGHKDVKAHARHKVDLRTTYLFAPTYVERNLPRTDEIDYNLEGLELDQEGLIKAAKVRFTLSFDAEENIVFVTIVEGKDIEGDDDLGFADPYVTVALIPGSKKVHKTKVKNREKNPVYKETFRFKRITFAGLKSSQLRFKVFDCDLFSSDDILGEAIVPVVDLDLGRKVDEWRMLRSEFKAEKKIANSPDLGHMCIGLAYQPRNSVLAVFMLGCKDLPALDEGGFSDPYIKFWLVQDGKKVKKRKTTVKMRTLNPSHNERFDFEVDSEKIKETSLMFVVADYDKGEKGEAMGELLLGFLGTGLQEKHWEKMIRRPGMAVSMWHRLRQPTITE